MGKQFVGFLAIPFMAPYNVVSTELLHHSTFDALNSFDTQTARNLTEENTQNGSGYAKVYTMEIPKERTRDSDIEQFVLKIDLLSASKQDDGKVTLSILVHNQEQDDLISTIKPSFEMVEDVKETSKLNTFVRMPHVSGQSIDTISGYPCYRNIDGMLAFMYELEDRASAINFLDVETIDIGDSYEKTENPNEGYDILALKITGDGVAAKGWTTNKGIVFVTCGVHAREYSPPELCARWAEILIDGYGNDTEITSLLDHTEVHMIIESNPDGRLIAETQRNLFQRKNTRPGCRFNNFLFGTPGVDLNRNFPFKWGLNSGSSSNKCDETYRGSAPASEPEVQAIIAYAETIFPESQRKDDPIEEIDEPFPEDTTIGVYYDIHSYGDLIIWPWAYEERVSGNEESLQAAARKLKSFNNYALAGPDQPAFLYPASGVTDDYFYGELGALSFTYELGTDFYQDCDTFENIIFPVNIPGFMYTAKISTKPYSLVKGPDIVETSIPSTINYHPTTKLDISITVSDSELSVGPGNYPPSTQNIASIIVCADMHPYDIDSNGNGPQIATIQVPGSPDTTKTQTILAPLSALANVLQAPLIGNHTLYLQGSDSDGYIGPVMAVSFDITCNDEASIPIFGVERECAWIASEGGCNIEQGQILCPSTCNIC